MNIREYLNIKFGEEGYSHWTPEEKIQWTKLLILEESLIRPKGKMKIRIYTQTGGETEYDPTFLTKSEQKYILKKIEEEGLIKNLEFDNQDSGIIYLDNLSNKTIEKFTKDVEKKNRAYDITPKNNSIIDTKQAQNILNKVKQKAYEKSNYKIYYKKIMKDIYEQYNLTNKTGELYSYCINSTNKNSYDNSVEKFNSLGLTAEYIKTMYEENKYEDEEIGEDWLIKESLKKLEEDGYINSIDTFNYEDVDFYSIIATFKINEIKVSNYFKHGELARLQTEVSGNNFTQKIIHEHKFDNSVQEQKIIIKVTEEAIKKNNKGLYITKTNDDFIYKGKNLNLSKTSDYYKVFSSLFSLLPEGGEIDYDSLIAEVKNRIPSIKNKPRAEIITYIQNKLTGKQNGFLKSAKIKRTEDNGKSLIKVNRGVGIIFNNKAG